jgi:tetratricopeptide (TPR) repeat protein
VHPKEGLYVLLLAILQQQNDVVSAAEVLEQLVKQYPAKKDYWPSLWASYLNMANEATVSEKKDEAKAREFYVRAINTMERAQAVGLMNSPKDNLTLVNLYLTAGQFGIATDLLYSGLKNGKIENDQKNWQTLGYFYQQANMETKAITALREASKLFPKTGQFELQIGQIYLSIEKTKEAYTSFQEAIRRGGLDKPHAVYQALAYAAFELEEFDEALKACDEAVKFPEGAKDQQLPKLRYAIEASIKEREYAKAEAAKKRL